MVCQCDVSMLRRWDSVQTIKTLFKTLIDKLIKIILILIKIDLKQLKELWKDWSYDKRPGKRNYLRSSFKNGNEVFEVFDR